MEKKHKKQIELMLGMAVQDIEQTGIMSIRLLVIKPDGTEFRFPPPQSFGVSLNLVSHSARMIYKKAMQMEVEKGKVIVGMFLYNSMITKPGDLVDNPNGETIYLLCMTVDGKIVIRQDYTVDENGKPVLGEKKVYDHDPEQSQMDYGTNAETLISLTNEEFAAIPEEDLAEGLPKEWIDYVHRERQNRDEDEWYCPKRATESSITDKKEGGSHEVPAAEETV